MAEPDEPRFAPGVREQYQRGETVGADARQRLLERIRRAPRPRRRGGWLEWVPGAGGLTPLRASLITAGLLALVGGALVSRAVGPSLTVPSPAAPSAAAGTSQSMVRFELAAPGAAAVALVGDFNDWDPRATPMRRTETSATWSVSLPVARGRHVYGFLVDGRHWVPDPSAPLAPEEDFGSASSVILVAGVGSS
jgi:hypothetical protein